MRGSIEYLASNSKKVKITPLIKDQCGCDHSLYVDESIIACVENTAESHYCCGKMHSIVQIYFKEGATIPVADAIHHVIDSIKLETNLMQWKKHIKMAGELLSPF